MEMTFVDHGKPWKNHGIIFLNFCGNPVQMKVCAIMLSVVKMPLKGEVGGCALNSHGNYFC